MHGATEQTDFRKRSVVSAAHSLHTRRREQKSLFRARGLRELEQVNLLGGSDCGTERHESATGWTNVKLSTRAPVDERRLSI